VNGRPYLVTASSEVRLWDLTGQEPAGSPRHASPISAVTVVASRAAAIYAMASSEKLGTALAYKITDLSEIAGIITDEPDHPTIRQLRDQGTIIIQAT
jgi:DeoR/GlpR family transcriptional regulator of sugar metabolism